MTEASRSLATLLQPRSIAVIGASTRLESLGGKTFANLLAAGFTGHIHPVNPKAEVVQGVPAVADPRDLPDGIEQAVLIVPPEAVEPVLEVCGEKGVATAVIITAGFSETGEEGAERERRLLDVAERHGMRLLGPNCMGAVNTDPEVNLDTTFSPVPVIRGGVGLVSQSGALGVAILSQAEGLNLGFSSFISVGNMADIGIEDALGYWLEDERTRVVTMYLESFGDADAFARVAEPLARTRPVIVVKAGGTEAGARAASSHTGALATDERAFDALLRQCGILRAPTVQDMCFWAAAFERCPLPAGKRVAIVTNAGGPAIMAADACSRHGLELPGLSPATRQELAAFLPPAAALGNPVDMISSSGPEEYRRTVEIVAGDPEIDAVLVVNVTPPLGSTPEKVIEAIAGLEVARRTPVVAAVLTGDDFYPAAARIAGAPPIYRFPEPAVGALAALARYAERRRLEDVAFDTPAPDREAILARLPEPSASAGGLQSDLHLLDPAAAAEVLAAASIPVPEQSLAPTPEEAGAAAARIGGPVALKAVVPGLLHKADIGGVALSLQGSDETAAAARRMNEAVAAAGEDLAGFVVQEMVPGGIELIMSTRRDEQFGPLLLLGLGGFFTEALADVAVGRLPLSRSEAGRMLSSLAAWPVLAGTVRGAGVHLESLLDLIGALARLAEDIPELVEIELNPVLCSREPDRHRAVDAVLRVRPRP